MKGAVDTPHMTAARENRIRILFIDLDGTLLNSRAALGDDSRQAIKRCTDSGVTVVIATARPPRSSKTFHDLLKLDTPSIHYNGALVYDFPSRHVLLHRPIPAPRAKALHDRTLQIDPSAVISLEVCDRWYTNRRIDTFKTETERIGFLPDYVGPLFQFLTEPVTKVLISFPEIGIAAGAGALQDEFDGKLAFTKSEEGILQVMDEGVTKGAAAAFLMNKLGIAREQSAAIGDAPNDIPMLLAVGLPIAMANAYPETKAAAREVTAANDENGVALAIERLILRDHSPAPQAPPEPQARRGNG